MPVMGRQITLTLDRLDIGQLLEGLEARAQSWGRTAKYLSGENSEDELFLIEECDHAEEAKSIERHYRAIIAKIRQQMEAQL